MASKTSSERAKPGLGVPAADPEVVEHVGAGVRSEDEVRVGHEVALGEALMDGGGAGCKSRLGVEVGGERLVLDVDERTGLGGEIGIVGDHDRHGLARVAHAVDRDERAVGEDGPVVRGDAFVLQVAADEHRSDAPHALGAARIDGLEDSVRRGRAQDLAVQHARDGRVDRELGPPADALVGVRGRNPAADGACACPRRRGGVGDAHSGARRRSAASSTASRIFT